MTNVLTSIIESQYAQIEKGTLVLVFACIKIMILVTYTDRQPLVNILNKYLCDVPHLQ